MTSLVGLIVQEQGTEGKESQHRDGRRQRRWRSKPSREGPGRGKGPADRGATGREVLSHGGRCFKNRDVPAAANAVQDGRREKDALRWGHWK